MLFSSVSFLLFFLPSLLAVYFCVSRRFRTARNLVLLIFSLFFYGCGGVKFLLLMLASIMINYIGGMLASLKNKRGAKWGMIGAVICNLLLLGYFKYTGFFTQTLHSFIPSVEVVNVVLPIGISFYTFQGLAYVVDVYRGDTRVQKNPLWVALYISLFPQLIAGPIVRYQTIADEIKGRRENMEDFSAGCVRFMIGFGKKMLLANAAGRLADIAFGFPSEHMSVSFAWMGALAYTAQIYFDFSAYSDMAIGMGRMFGFHFLENFNYPYISKSVTEFWRRWHISLSSWFRDYVYIPLGGNRCSVPRHMLNIMIVWFLTGMWHGASWNFIIWGLYFGIILLIEKYLLAGVLDRTPSIIRHIYTMVLVVISWVIFRSEDLSAVWTYLGAMFGIGAEGFWSKQTVYYFIQFYPEWILFFICSTPVAMVVGKYLTTKKNFFSGFVLNFVPKIFAVAVFILGYIELVNGSFNPFIYFRF